jgi:hypothetical protein
MAACAAAAQSRRTWATDQFTCAHGSSGISSRRAQCALPCVAGAPDRRYGRLPAMRFTMSPVPRRCGSPCTVAAAADAHAARPHDARVASSFANRVANRHRPATVEPHARLPMRRPRRFRPRRSFDQALYVAHTPTGRQL